MPTPKPAIGVSDFKSIIEDKSYYIDKSLLVEEVLTDASRTILLPRPRRFGKTINLSMLRYFLEETEPSHGYLFKGLAISKKKEMMAHQGQYPVIFLTFKDVKKTSFEHCLEQVQHLVFEEYRRHQSALDSLELVPAEQADLDAILNKQASQGQIERSLQILMSCLYRAYDKKVVVLLDEYDVPIQAGFQYDFYEEVTPFIRSFLSGAFKDNPHIEKGVITGILKVAKESIFSGLNNLGVYSLLDNPFSQQFGFTEEETQKLLKDFNRNLEEVQQWYNGYQFGKTTIYNPWSLLNYVAHEDQPFKAYWINTSSNELIRDLIRKSDTSVQEKIELLLNGDALQSTLNESIVFRDLEHSEETVWSLLTFSGYLKPSNIITGSAKPIYELKIPNQEVFIFYHDSVQHWIREQSGSSRLDSMLNALTKGDIKTFGKHLRDLVLAVLSYHDVPSSEPEKVYHVFFLGLLTHLDQFYTLRSNRESGYGRYDLLMIPKDPTQLGFVFEFKKIDPDDDKDHKDAMDSALKQIQDKAYATEIRESGVNKVIGIGVVIEGKQTWVQSIEL